MDESQITLQDYESRHQRIREFLIAEGLGALFVYSPPVPSTAAPPVEGRSFLS